MKAFSSSRHFAQKFTNLNDSADCGALGLPLAEPLHVGHADAHPARRRVLGNVARIDKPAERDLIPRSRVCPAALDHAAVAQVGDPQPRDVPDGFGQLRRRSVPVLSSSSARYLRISASMSSARACRTDGKSSLENRGCGGPNRSSSLDPAPPKVVGMKGSTTSIIPGMGGSGGRRTILRTA
jgi:hypothetical protein